MSRLCLSCGLCCTDLLFARAPVSESEVTGLARLGLRPERRGEKVSFPLPCAAHRNGCCAVYDDRPQVCRRYRCELLKNVEAGRIPLNVAEEVVSTTVGLLRRVDEHLPPASDDHPAGPSPRLRALSKRLAADGPASLTTLTLSLDVALLGEMMTKYFLPPAERREPSDGDTK